MCPFRRKTPAGVYPSLRLFITVTITLIVALILVISMGFYYARTSSILKESSRNSIIQELDQVNETLMDQVDAIDAIIPLFMSNELIQQCLEPGVSGASDRISVERQMSYVYNSSPLSEKNFTDSIFLIRTDGTIFHSYTSGAVENISSRGLLLKEAVDERNTQLMCRTLPGQDESLFFARNLYSSSTGNRLGTVILNINASKWIRYCARNLDPAWFITLFNPEIRLHSDTEASSAALTELYQYLSPQSTSISFQEMKLDQEEHFVAAQSIRKLGLVTAVAAPKNLLLRDLNRTLKSYLIVMLAILAAALAAAVIISRIVTRPVEAMIGQINAIAQGNLRSMPATGVFREFRVWADAFNRMLKQLDTYYQDSYQQKLLLKNAEIRALQSQMDPHFLFNVLNTIAWKAQITDQEEIYDMVISLGSLMKMNAFSRDHTFLPLEKEMEYVRLYVYLQQMRFEDKISCDIRIPEDVLACQIPCFSIQPLVENAIVHGLEPKQGKGRLIIQVIRGDHGLIEICIIDNGVGFETVPDISSIVSSGTDSHTHIGLKNLNKRLELLYGASAGIRITSLPGKCTTVSFTIPGKETGL